MQDFPFQICNEPSDAPVYTVESLTAREHKILQFLPKAPDDPFNVLPLICQSL